MLNFSLLKQKNSEKWERYTKHTFVQQIGSGTLPENNFMYYLCQDYVFLMQYAKAWAYAVYRAETQEQMDFAYKGLSTILGQEIELHLSYCEKWGISKNQLFNTDAHPNNSAYTSYVLHCGEKGTYRDIITALSPCFLGYAEIGKWLVENPDTNRLNNPYTQWIEVYGGKDFQEAAKTFENFMNTLYKDILLQDIEKQQKIFLRATELEIGFWDMAMEV